MTQKTSIGPVDFFVPYLCLYLIFWCLNWPVVLLGLCFQVLHLVLGVTVVLFLIGRNVVGIERLDRKTVLSGCLFWGMFALALWVPGAYLEYPSDPWENVRRIFQWDALSTISSVEDDSKQKFAYFWMWTLTNWLPFSQRHAGLDVLSAFWQMLVAVQFFRLCRRLGSEFKWACLQVLAFTVMFGTNLFSYRYYSLSSSPLAYAAFLDGLILIIDSFEKRRPGLLLLLPLRVLIILFNHIQELIFLAANGAVLALYYTAKLISPQRRRALFLVIAAALYFGFAIGPFLAQHQYLYSNMREGQVSYGGSFRIWDWRFEFFQETIAVHGWLGLLIGLVLLRFNTRVALLTLTPTFLLLYPPTVLLLSVLLKSGYLAYRILYATPLSLPLIEGLRVAALLLKVGRIRLRFGLAAALVLALALPSTAPWRGRLRFQFYSPPPERSFKFMTQTAEWFSKHRKLDDIRRCHLISDNATRFVLYAHLGGTLKFAEPDVMRRLKRMDGRELIAVEALNGLIQERHPLCGILVGIRQLLPITPPTPIGSGSGHWTSDQGDLSYLISQEFETAARHLVDLGWRMTPVPPHYVLYEPPPKL